ncbi:MAG: NAD-dependent epimerase/dehydratase family protein, partial [Cyanobacteria bacterium J06635_1]
MSNQETQTQTVLVTGATGFIGGHLLPALSQANWQIVAAVRSEEHSPFNVPVRSAVVGDIDGETDWHTALEGVDTVVHLAARAHQLKETYVDPERDFQRVNVQGTANLVRQCV